MRTARTFTSTLVAAGLAAGLLLTGCSSDSDDTTVGDADGGASASVGIAAAPGQPDPGKYRTTPRPAFGEAGDDNMGRIVEGQRMAEFVTLPGEIDPELTVLAGMSTYVIKNASASANVLGEQETKIAEKYNMVNGFTTSRYTPGNQTQNKSIVHAVLRFPDAESAQQAAKEMPVAGLNPTYNGEALPTLAKRTTAIDILPNTMVTVRITPDEDGKVSTEGFTAHGDYVIYDWAESLQSEQNWQATTIAKALSLQGPLIDKFPATPVADLPKLPIDIDSVLVYAVPPADGRRTTNEQAVWGPHGAAHFQTNGLQNLQDFTDTGTTRIASDASTVYLVDDAKGAVELFNRFMTQFTGPQIDPTDDPWTKIDGPAGVADAQCLTSTTISGTQVYYCAVQRGNYIGETGGTDEADIKQRITAQSMILDAAAKQ